MISYRIDNTIFDDNGSEAMSDPMASVDFDARSLA